MEHSQFMKFTDSHEWIRVIGNRGIVGISKHAQKELGEVVYIELPKLGKVIKAKDEVAVIESTKAASDIYSPVSGTILEVNEVLKANPDLINTAPESEGWIFAISLEDPSELEHLLDDLQYFHLVS